MSLTCVDLCNIWVWKIGQSSWIFPIGQTWEGIYAALFSLCGRDVITWRWRLYWQKGNRCELHGYDSEGNCYCFPALPSTSSVAITCIACHQYWLSRLFCVISNSSLFPSAIIQWDWLVCVQRNRERFDIIIKIIRVIASRKLRRAEMILSSLPPIVEVFTVGAVALVFITAVVLVRNEFYPSLWCSNVQ